MLSKSISSQFSPTRRNIYKKQHGARPCVEKMQFIFFVPPNEELEGTLHPQKFGCTLKNEGKRVHVPPDEKNPWPLCLFHHFFCNIVYGQFQNKWLLLL
jgi:hypothetical protein